MKAILVVVALFVTALSFVGCSEITAPVAPPVVAQEEWYSNPPTDLVASIVGKDVQLNWTSAPEILTRYRIYRNGTMIGEKAKSPNFRDTTAVPGTVYSYYVTEVNLSLEHDRTNTVYIRTAD